MILDTLLSTLDGWPRALAIWCFLAAKAGLLLGPLIKCLTNDPSPLQGAAAQGDRVGGSFIHNGSDI